MLKITVGADVQVSFIGGLLPEGRYKWGGGCAAADGTIIGVPSDCGTVLRINPLTDEVTTFGSLSSDKNKWQGAVLAPNNLIYAIPCNANSVLRIDPNTEEIRHVGNLPPGKDKYQVSDPQPKFPHVLSFWPLKGCMYCVRVEFLATMVPFIAFPKMRRRSSR